MRRVALLIALAVAGVACGGSGGEDRGISVGDASPSTSSPAQPAGGSLLDFTLPGVDGPDVHGESYLGRSVALWFWAPW